MTNLTGYYSYDNGKSSYSSTTTSKTYSTTLSETQTWSAKIKDSTGEESEVVTEEIHIMANYSLQTNYKVVGNIYPTLVTGTTSGSTTLYGTDTYRVDSSIRRAAIHMGLVGIGEERLLKIKIVECPEGGYVGSTRNGISSNSRSAGTGSSYYGFVFIGEDGEEIKAPTIESVTQVPEEGQATIGIEATAYNDNRIAKYYYKLNDGEYIESDVATYTFTGLELYKNNTITVYVKDTDNLTSEEKTITVRVTGKITLSGYPVIYNNEYGFINEEDTVVPNNGGVQNSTANSYIEIDLSNYSADSTYTISIEAEVSSENNYDYGYATITTQTTAPSYDSTDGRFVYICGTVANKEYTSDPLVGGQKYYLHLGYRKDGSRDTGNDKVIFKNLKIQ